MKGGYRKTVLGGRWDVRHMDITTAIFTFPQIGRRRRCVLKTYLHHPHRALLSLRGRTMRLRHTCAHRLLSSLRRSGFTR